MRLKSYRGLALAFLLFCAMVPMPAQTTPAATETRQPWAIGAGISGFKPDLGHGHLYGGTLWIDYMPTRVPSLLRGIGLEVEARDLNYGRSSSLSSNLRQDTIGGGVIYSWPHFHSFRPYGKFLIGYGNTDYGRKPDHRLHDSRTVTSCGGGVEYRLSSHVWLRGDYEYQFWPSFYKATKPAGKLNPQGFTVGALYHFGHRHSSPMQ
jgi:hypothetical protein